MQYEVNAFVQVLLDSPDLNITLQDLDNFAHEMQVPANGRNRRLSSTFLQNSAVLSWGSHLKGYASETLMACQALSFFFQMQLEPRGILLDHGRSSPED